MCIITLAFQAIFDNMADDYKLKRYRFSNMIIVIHALYDQAPSLCQVNGYVSTAFNLKISIRQRCPLCILLYSTAINPLLEMQHHVLSGTQLKPGTKYARVIVYANDVKLWMSRMYTKLYKPLNSAWVLG